MKETPLLMCGSMVVATMEDRKTQTRRVMLPVPDHEFGSYIWTVKNGCSWADTIPKPEAPIICGAAKFRTGDLLYFKETHYRWGRWRKDGLTKTGRQRWRFKAVPWEGESNGIRFCVNETRAFEPAKKRNKLGWHKRPSIFMPRLAARLRATITDVRVERVQSITEEDAEAEGVELTEMVRGLKSYAASYRAAYASLWNQLNDKRGFGWKTNCWVWVLTFKRIK